MDEASDTHSPQGYRCPVGHGTRPSRILTDVTSQLAAVPVERRRRAGATAALVAAFLVPVGVLPWFGPAPGLLRVFSAAVLVVAVLLALIGWGLVRSTRIDARAAVLNAAVDDVLRASGGACDCGHEHDPDEMHVTDAPSCGAGDACSRSCETCVLAAHRN